MSYNNDLSMKYLPFNSFSIEKKLPYIPTLINEDKKKIIQEIYLQFKNYFIEILEEE